MTHKLTTIYAKNCYWTLIVKVIIENVVTCFLGHSALKLVKTTTGLKTRKPS